MNFVCLFGKYFEIMYELINTDNCGDKQFYMQYKFKKKG